VTCRHARAVVQVFHAEGHTGQPAGVFPAIDSHVDLLRAAHREVPVEVDERGQRVIGGLNRLSRFLNSLDRA
jgi:hypothetical protein